MFDMTVSRDPAGMARGITSVRDTNQGGEAENMEATNE